VNHCADRDALFARAHCLGSSPSKLSSSKVGAALKLRGGGVSAADAQTVVAGLMGLSSGIG
tara:strand:+ start:133 stop:315 length:183 start_codon:yes stop_codon:yes gene_type:complete